MIQSGSLNSKLTFSYALQKVDSHCETELNELPKAFLFDSKKENIIKPHRVTLIIAFVYEKIKIKYDKQ